MLPFYPTLLPLTVDDALALTALLPPRAAMVAADPAPDHMLLQQTANRAWLLQHRRWLRTVETTHLRRQMTGQWRWLYDAGSNEQHGKRGAA